MTGNAYMRICTPCVNIYTCVNKYAHVQISLCKWPFSVTEIPCKGHINYKLSVPNSWILYESIATKFLLNVKGNSPALKPGQFNCVILLSQFVQPEIFIQFSQTE